jgi:hypothetical protein
MDSLISMEDFNPELIVLEKPKSNKHGGSVIPVKYDCPTRGKIRLLLKTPRAPLPYGVSQFPRADDVKEGEEGKIKYNLNVSYEGFKDKFKGEEKIGVWFDKFKKLETVLVDKLYKGRKLYLGDDKLTKEIIKYNLFSMVKHSKNKDKEITDEYCPTTSFKLPRYVIEPEKKPKGKSDKDHAAGEDAGVSSVKSRFGTKVHDKDGHEITLTDSNLRELFPPRTDIRAVISCSSIWNISGRLSMSWRAEQVKLYPNTSALSYAFGKDSDDEEPEADEAPAKSRPVASLAAADSEDDVEVKAKPAPAPVAPVPVVAEKKVAEKPVKGKGKAAAAVVVPPPAPVKPVSEDEDDGEDDGEDDEDEDDDEGDE